MKPACCRAIFPNISACACWRSFQRGELPIPGGHRRGGARPAHRGCDSCDQLRSAAGTRDYVHRIGRTARVGASGDAISFACEEYVYSLPEIEDFIGQKISALPVTEDLLLGTNRPSDWSTADRHPAAIARATVRRTGDRLVP